ncbi:MAG: PhzF family phenazine biosynthesis isomerase [Acidimicrobiia bacterium]|nr:PhzF family phenazine biosynthesis isomerase [Acidimicrobiia bacterium]
MRRRLTWVDAFTDVPLSGNPCVVVFEADDVTVDQRIAFTKETRLSECAFLQRTDEADFGVRYYTASGEIPMAGHPTIATITALADSGLIVPGTGELSLEVGAGVLPITIEWEGDLPVGIAMRQFAPEFGREYPISDIASLVGLVEEDFLDVPQTVSTGTPFLICPLVSHEALRRVQLDEVALRGFHDGGADFFEPFLTSLGGATAEGDVFSRLILTPPEPPEDPFTGSATGCMAAYLWSHGLIDQPRFVAEQGHWMDRPGRAEVEVLGPPDAIEGILVSGAGTVVMRGQVEL